VRTIIAGGGTGGHVFPGIALGSVLRERGAVDVLFVGTGRGLEATAAPQAGFAFEAVPARQVRGGGILRAIGGGFALARAVATAIGIIRRFRPDLVVGVGGYAAAPVVLAAWLSRIPVLLLEQNVIPGATNRVLGRLARRVCVSFPETATSFAGVSAVCTGNPVRAAVLQARERRRPESGGAVTLLVVGGSAGAHRLNVQVVEGVARLRARVPTLRVVHQTGAADAEATRSRYRSLGVEADVQPFFEDMARLYEAADVAICRAGATTIAELLVVGVPSILVPYPYAADDHQRRNAEAVMAAGAGLLVLDRDLTGERVETTLGPLLDDAARRQAMSRAACALARPDAGQLVADECVALVARSRHRK
jgi:UDP-N-acetylglucosamine--N-acetylmuramyl-(pentapeptide) pyrophosphoryl-undecaprenol N-acetylglucosamine transferase